jgi:hypothetical protein
LNTNHSNNFVVRRIADVQAEDSTQKWLVKTLWGLEAVGILGGAPKCCKSWLGLDIAISVASKTPCLDHFQVEHQGPALVYLAEDAAPMVRERVLGICKHRRLDIQALDLNIIDIPSLRLDLDTDRTKLVNAIERIKPKLLLLDPLVRLHRADENSSAEISALLGFLRELQRQFNMAVILVHHMSKKHRAQLGQALRGSGDLHAFGDCNAYLVKNDKKLLLSVEHRFAPPLDPMKLDLVSNEDGNNTHLELASISNESQRDLPLTESVRLTLADADEPLTRVALRNILHVNNKRLGLALCDLENNRTVIRGPSGWTITRRIEPTTENINDLLPLPLI